MRDELKPCPFCGSANVSHSLGETGDGQPWPYVECEECAATAMPEHWNTRQAQAQGSEDLASWLRWVAGELVKRDTQGGTFAQGVAQSLCGRAYILEYVAHKKAAAHAQAGEGSNG